MSIDLQAIDRVPQGLIGGDFSHKSLSIIVTAVLIGDWFVELKNQHLGDDAAELMKYIDVL